MTLKTKYAETVAVAVFPECNWGGLEILDVEYGINDTVIACYNFGSGRTSIRRHRIYDTASGRSYIRKGNRRYYLDDMMLFR